MTVNKAQQWRCVSEERGRGEGGRSWYGLKTETRREKDLNNKLIIHASVGISKARLRASVRVLWPCFAPALSASHFLCATMPAYSVPYVHSGDPAYAPPLLRVPSPTSSIGTDYGPDETPDSEKSISATYFARACQDKLRLDDIRPEEVTANRDPLLPKCSSDEEERCTCNHSSIQGDGYTHAWSRPSRADHAESPARSATVARGRFVRADAFAALGEYRRTEAVLQRHRRHSHEYDGHGHKSFSYASSRSLDSPFHK